MKPPYYAVSFSSNLKTDDPQLVAEYDAMGDRMLELATIQKGFLGVESVRDTATTTGKDGHTPVRFGITISYWETLEDIRAWKRESEHLEAQRKGKAQWYENYTTRISKVEREYSFQE
ncbi:hypothetical protein BABINDRAFT_166951 [Babjeviella inositovora NRRL Y-12698]|uniref:DUF3291 domain-containing protein n=1 Tax=Babjeviella inositovora NRRL Y-12698 TaxID=984486 RepID=A0A1E3QQA4_9ASCO|nr:uncharacterized protein BABINDRAFT_166951 [Babjeviella inositovora NRRL Y-12698]ODQ79851.1 hypothetical protein BABINDRAFT_166951 [Babjeviella inositovora NRRL Y-12698]